jgi:hypothetical protein
VKLSAVKDLVGLAGGDVSLFGVKGASFGSAVAASIAGGLSASMKGLLFAGVGSVLTTLKGVKKIEMASDHGKAVFSAKKTLEASAHDSFLASGDDCAQVSSEKDLLLGGKRRAWIGTPAGGGWGALFIKSGVAIGKATRATNMERVTMAQAPVIRIDDDKIEIKNEGTCATLSNSKFVVEAPGIRIDARKKNVRFNNSRVLELKK